MAILRNGLAGGISGKVGNVVYYMMNGKQMSRVIGRRTKPPTEKELANWQAMTVATQFVRSVNEFIKAGFAREAKARKMQPQNAAVSYNRKHALKGQYPNIEIDYTKVLLSTGNLHGLRGCDVVLQGDAQEGFALCFTWNVLVEDQAWCSGNDQVMLMAYCPEAEGRERAWFNLYGAMRHKGQDVLELPSVFTGKFVEVYVAVVAADRMRVSESRYVGRLEVG